MAVSMAVTVAVPARTSVVLSVVVVHSVVVCGVVVCGVVVCGVMADPFPLGCEIPE
jgi:hypothetical protein